MSRLEAEMQVYTEDAGEYTLGLLDKGNGKAGEIDFFLLRLGAPNLGTRKVSFGFYITPPRKMKECHLTWDCFKRKIVF